LLLAVAGGDDEASAERASIGRALAAMGAALRDDADGAAREAGEGPRVVAQLHTRGEVRRYHLTPAGTTVEARPPADFSDAATLRRLLDEEAPEPRRPTALFLYGHGSGLDEVRRKRPFGAARPGGLEAALPPGALPKRLGPDPTSGRFLTNRVLRDAIAGSLRRRVDVLALNACSMALLELTDGLRDVATVQLASQVDATIWPYHELLAALVRAPDLPAEELARALVGRIEEQLARRQRRDTLVALRSAELEALTAAFQEYARQATSLLRSQWDDVRAVIIDEAQRVYDPYQVDLLSLTGRLAARRPELTAAAAEVRARFAAARVACAVAPERGEVHGLSLFCPDDVEVELEAPYRGTRFAHSHWALFLRELHGQLAQLQGAQAPPAAPT
jgi:hypothetical protein